MVRSATISVSSTTDSPAIQDKAATLAARLNLPFSPVLQEASCDYVLCYSDHGLQILASNAPPHPLCCLLHVDFIGGKNGYRLAKNRTIKQPLARAVGIRSGFRPTICDATAGLGADSFVLASLGCQVTMCERSPLLGALLEDGLHRALKDGKTKKIVCKHLRLFIRDSRHFLLTTTAVFDTIYLDPMYPHRKRSALNKQTLRIIRILVGDDLDGGSLLNIALKRAANRVVVKRPAAAPYLGALPPHHSIAMKSSRFDVYLTNPQQPFLKTV